MLLLRGFGGTKKKQLIKFPETGILTVFQEILGKIVNIVWKYTFSCLLLLSLRCSIYFPLKPLSMLL